MFAGFTSLKKGDPHKYDMDVHDTTHLTTQNSKNTVQLDNIKDLLHHSNLPVHHYLGLIFARSMEKVQRIQYPNRNMQPCWIEHQRSLTVVVEKLVKITALDKGKYETGGAHTKAEERQDVLMTIGLSSERT